MSTPVAASSSSNSSWHKNAGSPVPSPVQQHPTSSVPVDSYNADSSTGGSPQQPPGEASASLSTSHKLVGYLKKQSPRGMTWQKRYFVGKDDYLCYYSQEQSRFPKGSIYIGSVTKITETTSIDNKTFTLETKAQKQRRKKMAKFSAGSKVCTSSS